MHLLLFELFLVPNIIDNMGLFFYLFQQIEFLNHTSRHRSNSTHVIKPPQAFIAGISPSFSVFL